MDLKVLIFFQIVQKKELVSSVNIFFRNATSHANPIHRYYNCPSYVLNKNNDNNNDDNNNNNVRTGKRPSQKRQEQMIAK